MNKEDLIILYGLGSFLRELNNGNDEEFDSMFTEEQAEKVLSSIKEISPKEIKEITIKLAREYISKL